MAGWYGECVAFLPFPPPCLRRCEVRHEQRQEAKILGEVQARGHDCGVGVVLKQSRHEWEGEQKREDTEGGDKRGING